MRRLTLPQARRAALAASGLHRPRPDRVDVRHFRRVLRELDVVQLDSVNVVTRAHELPFFSRLGGHDVEALRRWLWHSREAHECWGHVASVMPMDAYPLLAHRRDEHRHPWDGVQRIMDEHPGFVEAVEAEVHADGPVGVSDLADAGQRSAHFWGWNPGKRALHWLFLAGRIAVHERTRSFLARYDAPGRVIPDAVRDVPPPPRERAQEALLLRAARAQGIGTVEDLADHHRLPIGEARAAAERLVRRGELVEVAVDGWDRPALARPDLRVPRAVAGRALLCPFDPAVWYRPRVERLFGFRYRIEIYVPAAKREYGYYVLPFLLGDALVARVDLKADRRTGRLLVRGAWAERGVDAPHVARELAAELQEMARWLDMREVAVENHGDLGGELRAAVG